MVALGLHWMLNPESPFWIRPRLDPALWRWGWRFWRAATREQAARAAPLLRDLHLRSRAIFEELAGRPGTDFGLERRGILMLCKSERALAEEAHGAESARALGLPAEVLDARRVAALEPDLRWDVCGGVHYPLDAHLDPARFVRFLERDCAAAGVELRLGAELAGWRREGRRIAAALTREGEVAAEEFVVCGGSWSGQALREVGLRLPLEAGKGYSLTLDPAPQAPRVPAILVEARVAVTPISARALRVGGTMELDGLDRRVAPRRVQAIVRSFYRYAPGFPASAFDAVEPWAGLRPCSPDGLPYLGRSRRLENLSIAAGHAMIGLSLGPASGECIAKILSGEKPSIDLGLLDPDRYG
jgi:D-amino-acid dehydrogenase